jgi:hypothetical protein
MPPSTTRSTPVVYDLLSKARAGRELHSSSDEMQHSEISPSQMPGLAILTGPTRMRVARGKQLTKATAGRLSRVRSEN